jgi:hypothetical protein
MLSKEVPVTLSMTKDVESLLEKMPIETCFITHYIWMSKLGTLLFDLSEDTGKWVLLPCAASCKTFFLEEL